MNDRILNKRMKGKFDWQLHNLFLFHVLEWHYFYIQNAL